MPSRVVVALGGNAILRAGQRGTADEQLSNIRGTCRSMAEMIADGNELVITHGNGPQVGNLLLQNEEAAATVPPMPLDVCGAESQGLIGYMIQRELQNELSARGIARAVVTVVTQVVVDPADAAFQNPTKPVGPYYHAEQVERLTRERGYRMKEFPGRGWRRVVPSPDPVAIHEREAILQLVDSGAVVIAAGGGGIPVYRDRDGRLVGLEAVIDKDLAGQSLARDVRADVFLILTDIDRVALNFGRPDQRFVDRLDAREAEALLSAGQFPPGTMGPKVLAAVRFVREGGGRAIIGDLSSALAALRGEAGTTIVPASTVPAS